MIKWTKVSFVFFHVSVLVLFAVPINPWPVNAAREMFAPYMRCLGLTDTWDMFAPNPKASEQYLRAVVITKRGEYKLYSFPRMEELGLADRYRKERYRKFTESLMCSDCGALWPDVERAVALREMNPADPPTRVILVTTQSAINPKTGAKGEDATANSRVLSQLLIQPEDLR